jgi:hypothetical protein
MNEKDYIVRAKAAPRTYNVLNGSSPSLLTIHQFHVEGIYYGRIWAPRTPEPQTVCRVSSVKLQAPSQMLQKFIVPDSRNSGFITFSVVYIKDPPPPHDTNTPSIVLTASQHNSDGISNASLDQTKCISLHDLRCGGHVGLQVGHIAIEIERDYPWRPSTPFIGNDEYFYADTL